MANKHQLDFFTGILYIDSYSRELPPEHKPRQFGGAFLLLRVYMDHVSAVELAYSRMQKKIMPIPECGCHVWFGSVSDKGYGIINMSYNYGHYLKTHRVAWEANNGDIPDGLHVLHKCDNPSCVNPDHLFLGTNAENVIDKVKKLRGNVKLTLQQRKMIRDEYSNSKVSQSFLAKKYEVSKGTINRIIHNQGII